MATILSKTELMPIYMDRHDILGVTAKDVAEVHQEDLKIQYKYKCRALTYWFDEERGTAFCLIEAPDKEAVKEMHNDAHGLVPNQIIEVESNLVEAFLGRIEDPEVPDKSNDSDLLIFEDPAFRTIIVTELKNAALINSKPGTVEGSELFRVHDEIIQRTLIRHDGREVKHTGDGFMASFVSASKSVKCAVEIQKRFKKYNRQASDPKIHVAIGLNAGDPVTDRGDFFGEAIQFTNRLCYIASEGQIVVSSTVKNLSKRERLRNLTEGSAIKMLNPMEEEFLNRLMDTTEQIWNQEGISVADFCKKIGLSKSQLYRKVTSLTGHSITDFIKEFRLKKAIKLIEKQQGNISQVAFETGFSNPSYFSKCFQKRFGILPSDYIKAIA